MIWRSLTVSNNNLIPGLSNNQARSICSQLEPIYRVTVPSPVGPRLWNITWRQYHTRDFINVLQSVSQIILIVSFPVVRCMLDVSKAQSPFPNSRKLFFVSSMRDATRDYDTFSRGIFFLMNMPVSWGPIIKVCESRRTNYTLWLQYVVFSTLGKSALLRYLLKCMLRTRKEKLRNDFAFVWILNDKKYRQRFWYSLMLESTT